MDITRLGSTFIYDNLRWSILSSLCVNSEEEMTRVNIIEKVEAKFQEEDVVLALKKYEEQHGRRPSLQEFYLFINSWEGMPTRKKSFAKLIDENIEKHRKNCELENKVTELGKKNEEQEEKIKALLAENQRLKGQ